MSKIIKNIIKSYIQTVGIGKFIFILFFGVFVALIVVLEPLIFTKIIFKIEEFYKTGVFDREGTLKLILFWAFFILFSAIVQYVFDYFLVWKSVLRNYVDLTNEYSSKIISMNYSDFLGKKQGSLYKIFDRGTDGHLKFLQFLFSDVIKSTSSIIIVIIIMFSISRLMTLLALSMIPVMVLLGVYFTNKVLPYQKKLNKKWDRVYGIIGNILSGFMLTKTLTIEPVYIKNIKKRLNIVEAEQLRISKYWSISEVYTSIIVMISRILVLGFGVFFVIDGKIAFGELFLFFSYIGWIYFPLGFLFRSLKNISEQITGVEKLNSEFDDLELEDINIGVNIRNIKGIIEYKNVKFGYSGTNGILNNVSFKINQGENIALVGNTGAGKSTIINLLLRFWDLKDGSIELDGININKISKKSLRKHIGIVTQDVSLYNDTVKNNLLFANYKATKIDIDNALKKAEATFVYDLKDGINTMIGERGLKLSGGEKQRLSIARLFLQNPEILILDEATSALDNKTEKLIQKALDKLMKGRTSIVIAHRLSTIQNADNIFMLEKGKIVEEGNYNFLIKKKAKFYNLANPEHLILN